jgi:hypothetical protein
MTTGFQDPMRFSDSSAQDILITGGSACAPFTIRVDYGLLRIVCSIAKPRFMKKVHIRVEEIASERRVREHVVDRAVSEMREIRSRGNQILLLGIAGCNVLGPAP